MEPSSARSAPTTVPPVASKFEDFASRFRGATAVVILPTLNEEEGLAHTLARLPKGLLAGPERRVETMVIDGGSTDHTLDVAREWGVPILRQQGRGKGSAVVETIVWVHSQGIPYAVVLDADATYPPDRVPDALDLLERNADLVVGVRRPVSGPAISGRELVHRLGNIGLSYTASLLSRWTIFDLCSGFWGVSTERFVSLGIEPSHFAIEAEMVLKSVRQGLRVVQIPVEYRERVGTAKLRAMRDGSRILLTIMKHGLSPGAKQTVQVVPPRADNDLLSIGLITGSTQAVLECAPSDTAAARDLASVLRRNFPGTVVRAELGPQNGPAGGSTTGTDPRPSPMVVSLSTAGSPGSAARAIAVSIGSRRRELVIELPSASGHAPNGGSALGTESARSGGTTTPGPGLRSSRFPSLEVLTSRLSYDVLDQQRAMLSANGFRVVMRDRPLAAPVSEPSERS
ncbi:MAG: glycosyltransferase family 2 protein [Thermoplasmata archaeon]|nr:glycosyltransferase family 2 protein [Thermoplasmata archaeon]